MPPAGASPYVVSPILVRLSGEWDMFTAPQLRESLKSIASAGPGVELVLDLAGVSFIDCAGLRPLLETRDQFQNRLSVTQVSPAVNRLLELAELTDAFRILRTDHSASQRGG